MYYWRSRKLFARRSQGFELLKHRVINRFNASQHVMEPVYGSTALLQPFCLKKLSFNEQRDWKATVPAQSAFQNQQVFGEDSNY